MIISREDFEKLKPSAVGSLSFIDPDNYSGKTLDELKDLRKSMNSLAVFMQAHIDQSAYENALECFDAAVGWAFEVVPELELGEWMEISEETHSKFKLLAAIATRHWYAHWAAKRVHETIVIIDELIQSLKEEESGE